MTPYDCYVEDIGGIPVKLRWRLEAACRDKPTEMFFPTQGDFRGLMDAKAVCDGCPVARECLKAGIEGNYDGVWGGTSHKQRLRDGRSLLSKMEPASA